MRGRIVVTTGIALAALGVSGLVRPAWRLSYNPSASAARGFYRLTPLPVAGFMIGDQVLAWPPASAARLADRRSYLPVSVPLLKTVSALFRARVCRFGAAVTIDGRLAAIARSRDHAGRPLPVWQGCRVLGAGEVFLLGVTAESFDSRYFGPVPRTALIARAEPLWTW